ncbi:GIY-YIG nuclease family protein [Exiguobacterium sp. SL-10]|jgi:putative endonuclease|uniref:GIY-YIG nuclease family protein n=1 Tax=unclassified Exiguobacterium TaxID=2644629 RepID=UPI001038F847|nr:MULTISPECIES: GIY-YIG nuclease family protein [unclassified Exiguobacterium]TCI20279.1 GIY-YIG nuclease family protein [Exiguobacterium sp. SL-9]TCI28315.1 GIY-YIG nuclease family protein [Exiguobacterium sp. SL-10]
MRKHYAYILECQDGTYYTGYTTNVEKRMETHNAGKGAKYTRARLPVTLRYVKSFETKRAAMQYEWSIKQLTRAQKQQLMEGTSNELTKKLSD